MVGLERFSKLEVRLKTSNNMPSTSVDPKMKGVYDALHKKFKGRQLLFGHGFVDAKLVVVGEAPVMHEETLKNMAPHSEKLLNQLLKSIGVNKNKVYFTTVLKHLPSPIKVPTSKEIKAYTPFLREELKMVEPTIVVTLGNLALNGIGLRQPLANIHGRNFNFGSYELFPTFHPELALKSSEIKSLLEADFLKLKQLIESKKTV